jgi:C-terminal processing protease CtpA/Prc
MNTIDHEALNVRTLCLCRLIACFAAVLAMTTQGAVAQDNSSFELQPDRRDQIPGWFTPPMVTEQGIQSRVIFTPGAAVAGDGVAEIIRPAEAEIFGQILQGIDPTPYLGKRVELSAFLRVEQLGEHDAEPNTEPNTDPARAQLWIRVDRERRARGFFDSMQDRPVLDNDRWNDIRIVGDVHPDATAIYIGVMTFGHSRVLVDDVRLEVLGDAAGLDMQRPLTLSTPFAQAAAPLTDRGARSLLALGNAVGYARWFSPAEGAMSTDWDRVLVGIIPAFEAIENDRDLANAIQDLLAPSVPGLAFWTGSRHDGPAWSSSETRPGGSETRGVHRRHNGLYRPERIVLGQSTEPLSHQLAQIPVQDWLPVGMPVERELVPGLWMRWTARLPVDDDGNAIPATRSLSAILPDTSLDREIRLASVLVAASTLDHFFPYADVVSDDYESELTEAVRTALREAAIASTTFDHVSALRRLLAITQDGHGGVYHSDVTQAFIPPFSVHRVDDDLVIARIDSVADGLGIELGDRIVSIDNIPIDEHLAEREAEISGSPQWRRWISSLQFGSSTEPAAFTVGVHSDDGDKRLVEINRIPAREVPVLEDRPESFSEVAPGIVYIDLTTITEPDLNIGFDAMKIAGRQPPNGIIFDMRGYPGAVNPTFLSRFLRVPVRSPNWVVPVIRLPDREHWETAQSRWLLEPLREGRLDCDLVFLMDARAISYAESLLGIIKSERLGTLVGSPTAGANGNVVTATLPGEITMAFTGMRVLKHDGRMHHITGVLPDIHAKPTIDGLRNGRDEVLDAGLKVLLEQLGSE